MHTSDILLSDPAAIVCPSVLFLIGKQRNAYRVAERLRGEMSLVCIQSNILHEHNCVNPLMKLNTQLHFKTYICI